MKVAQFIDTMDVGGAETMMFRLSEQLVKSGVDVTVFHFGNQFLAQMCEQAGIKHQQVVGRSQYCSIFKVHLFALRFARLLKQQQFKVLHTHLYGPVSGLFIATRLLGIRHVATLHDVYLVQERIGRGLLLSLASKLGVRLVSVSQDMAQFYRNYMPFKSNIVNIYNGIDVSPSLKLNQQNKVNDKSKTEQPLVLITVGRLVPLKRMRQLVENLASFLVGCHLELWLVGDGPERSAIEATVSQFNLGQKVKLLGQRDNVEELLSQADIFLLNSNTEGLSCSIIEAMAAGLPCIVSDVGGNRELVIDGENGFLYPVDNSNLLIQRLSQIISDNDLRAKMSSNSHQKALEQFTVQVMATNYKNIYQV